MQHQRFGGSGNVDFDVVVKNNGTVDINAGNSFDVQASIGVNDCSVSSQTQNISTGLAAGASTTLTFTLPIAGSGLVSFQADASGNITEGNESNNCLSDNSVIISSGLSGTYTINSGGDYTTVSAAAAALIAQGCADRLFLMLPVRSMRTCC
ncbi:MAG: CARDB domain-containing protein [Bacteroidia bacterium]